MMRFPGISTLFRPMFGRAAFLMAALFTIPSILSAEEPTMNATQTPPGSERVVLAGGCFWGMEDLIRKIPGVLSTRVGYAGGTTENPRYESVKTGRTGHAESVEIVFDPKRIAFSSLLGHFFILHDPTTSNRQGNDIGTQYRSAIFYTSDEQKRVAEQVKAAVQAAGQWPAPIVTEIVPDTGFTAAEDYHQDYLEKNPGGYTCHFVRDAVPGLEALIGARE